jgi:hypothetical protein
VEFLAESLEQIRRHQAVVQAIENHLFQRLVADVAAVTAGTPVPRGRKTK